MNVRMNLGPTGFSLRTPAFFPIWPSPSFLLYPMCCVFNQLSTCFFGCLVSDRYILAYIVVRVSQLIYYPPVL